jgi:hypothetical protein
MAYRPTSRRGRNASTGDKRGTNDIVSRYQSSPNRTSVITFPMNGSDAAKYPANTMTKKPLRGHGEHSLGKKGR